MTHTLSYLLQTYNHPSVSFVWRGDACLWGEHGIEYMEAIAAVAVTDLGHDHPEITDVTADQACMLLHTSNAFRINWQKRLIERLVVRPRNHPITDCITAQTEQAT